MNFYKFGIYTSFYNAEKYIDKAFDNFSKITYSNWEWIITDDFSSDNTKQLLLEKVKQYDFVHYVDQQHKKQMYWKPNEFFDDSFDYIVLIDCDDDFDFNFLEIYNFYANGFPNVALLSSDFIKVNEEDGSLHSISAVKNKFNLINSLDIFHPDIDYVKNHTYNTLGHLRCFKHLPDLKFEIDDINACAEDSYRMMWVSSLGKWLHIPRSLYAWNLRETSESHSGFKQNFNGNFDIAYNKLKNSPVDPFYFLNDVYKETSSLLCLGINQLHKKRINFISLDLDQEQIDKLKDLYFDCNLFFDFRLGCDVYSVICNYIQDVDYIKQIVNEISNSGHNAKIVFYYYEDKYHSDMESLDSSVAKNLNPIREALSDMPYSYFMYFRHNYIIVNL